MEDTGVVKARFEETEAENTSAELVVNIIAAVVQVGKAAVGAEIATFGVGNAAGAEAEIPVGRAAVGRAGVDLVAAGLVGMRLLAFMQLALLLFVLLLLRL